MKKINIVTYENSIFGLHVLNNINRLNIRINSVLVVRRTLSDLFGDFLHQIKRIGLKSTIYYTITILFTKYRDKLALRNSRLSLEYNNIAGKVFFIKSPNSKESLEIVEKLKPDLTILSHCGIVSNSFLKSSSLTINSHPGILLY